MRKAISVAIIHENKILLLRKNQTWILPGGKPEEGENDIACLKREFKEELPKAGKLYNLRDYYSFKGLTPHKNDILEAVVYFAELKQYPEEFETDREINKAEWVSDFSFYNLSDITSKAIHSLRRDGYLK